MVSSARKSRELSIQQIFLLLAILNGIVVISVWQLLHQPAASDQHAYTTIFLACLLVVGVAISYRIVSVRVTAPLGRLVRQSYALASGEWQSAEMLAVAGSDEIARLASAFNGVLERQRQANHQLDAANRRLSEVNKQVEDSIRYAALQQQSILPDRQLSERAGLNHFVLWRPRRAASKLGFHHPRLIHQ